MRRPHAAALLLAASLLATVTGCAASRGTTPRPAAASAAGPADTGPVATSSPAPSGTPSSAAGREQFATSVAVEAPGAAAVGARSAVPVAVDVPRIDVDSPVVALGIAGDGSLEVPDLGDAQTASWLASSAVPGQPGASVIAGHVDSRTAPAVFFRLHELVAGDEVDVRLSDGSTVVYVVDDVVRVAKDAFPTAAVYGPQPGPVLRLITCGGAFDRDIGHYEDNVIAFASAR